MIERDKCFEISMAGSVMAGGPIVVSCHNLRDKMKF